MNPQPVQPLSAAADLSLALEVHGELCALINPVTPGSIRASSWARNRALLVIIVCGVASALVFIVSELYFSELFLDPKSLQRFKDIERIVQALAGASLGSAFYSLYTATEFLQKSTFDPSYNKVYVVRFALGVFAGFILGVFANDFFESEVSKQIGPTALALAGGYSSEAVAQLLQRFADTLVTLVKGTGKERATAEARADNLRAMSKSAAELQEALAEADADARDRKVREISMRMLSGN